MQGILRSSHFLLPYVYSEILTHFTYLQLFYSVDYSEKYLVYLDA